MQKHIMGLEIRNLSVSSHKKVILSNISFTLGPQSFMALLGPSGSGKTTLVKTLLGLAQNLGISGEISFKNKLLQKDQRALVSLRDRRFAYIPQTLTLWPHLCVEETLKLCARWSGSESINNWPQDIIQLTGLTNHKNKKPSELSGGEKQRLALARVLVARPQLIIFDEPMSALDIIAKAGLIELIKKAQNFLNFSSVLITHDLNEAMALSEDILLLINGKNIWHGPKDQLEHAPFPASWPLTSYAANFRGCIR